MKNQKISQASVEYLSTYAFAFVAIVIAIGALYYFGFLDFGRYLPQKCVFPSQFKCLDFSLLSNEVKIKLINNLGENIKVTSLKITNDANPAIECLGVSPTTPFDWNDGDKNDISFTSCSKGAYIPNERVELKIEMKYYAIASPSQTPHIVNGKINGRVLS